MEEIIKKKIKYRALHNGCSQIRRLLQEECAEVIQAISKYEREENFENYRAIFDELADIENLKRQLIAMSTAPEGYWEQHIEDTILKKLVRQENR